MPAAANLRGSAIRLIITTGVVPAVDDAVATASRVRAVSLPHNRLVAAKVGLVVIDTVSTAGPVSRHDPAIAATVGPVVIDRGSTTGRTRAVRAASQHAVAANVRPVIIDRGVTTASVTAIGLGSDDASATHLRPVVVGGPAAAAGVATISFPSQLPSATDVGIAIIHSVVAAAVGGISVNTRPAATGISAVSLVANIAATTKI